MTSLRKFSIVLLVVAALTGIMASPAQAQLALNCNLPQANTLTVNVNSTFSCSASGGTAPYQFSIIAGAVPSGMSPINTGSEYFITGTPFLIGTYSFTVQVKDNVGAIQTQSLSITVASSGGGGGGSGSVSLSSVTPNSLSAGVATNLLLQGSGFTGSSVVFFNGFQIAPTVLSTTQLSVSVPAAYINVGTLPVYVRDNSTGVTSGVINVVVSNGGGGGGSVVITSLSPSSAPLNSPAVTLTIFGSGFSNGMLVNFGGLSTTSATLLNSGAVSTVIPATAFAQGAQTVNVSVGGSNNLPFTIGTGGSTGTLAINCNPTTGPSSLVFFTQFCTVSGGNGSYIWNVTGTLPTGLTQSPNGQSLTISGTPQIAQSYTYTINVSDTANNFGSLVISGSTGGSSGYSITSVSPSSAAVGNATNITVLGNGFNTASQVYFNGTQLGTTYISPNQLNTAIPGYLLTTAGSYNINVYTGGVFTNSLPFTVGSGSGSGVTLSSLSPTVAALNSQGFTLFLFGSGFTNGSLVNFGTNTLSSTFYSANQVSVFVPASFLTISQTINVSIGGSNSIPFTIGSGSSGTLSVTCSPTAGPTTLNASYFQTCTTSGGTAPYSWIVSGLPTGLSQSAYTGAASVTISGTPSLAQSYAYTVQVTDSSSTRLTGSLQVSGSVSSSAYSITSLAPSTIAVGSAQTTLTVFGTGFNTASVVLFNGAQLSTSYISANQLNAILPSTFLTTAQSAAISVSTSGIPTNSLTLTVGSGSSGGTLSLVCTPGVGPATVNTFYSTTCTATGGNGNYTWPAPSGLPSYLTYSTTTGSSVTISGTPNISTAYNFTVKVQDSSSPIQTGSLQLAGQTGSSTSGTGSIILTSLSPSSAALNAAATVLNVIGSGFSTNSQVLFDGIPITTSFLSSGQLTATIPAGLLGGAARAALVSVTTPGVGSSNSLTFIIGNGGGGVQISITCTPGVGPSSPNTYYTANCAANGGTGPFNWSVVSGSLPSGLVLNPNGSLSTITGYTTLNGPYSYTLQVTDSSNPVNTASLVFAGETGAGSGGGGTGFSLSSLAPASAAVGSQATTLVVNGSGFTTASQVYFNGNPLATTFLSTAQLSATIPAAYLTTALTASVTVISSGVTSNALTFTVGSVAGTGISISCNPTTGPSSSGASYLTTCTVSGGTAPYNWVGTGPAFMQGLVVTNANGQNTVSITGSLNATAYDFSLQVTDSSTPVQTASYRFFGIFPQTGATAYITSVSPINLPSGGGQQTLNITGLGFVSGVTTVVFNNTPLSTTVFSSTQLSAIVPATLLATPGTVNLQLIGTNSNTVGVFITSGTGIAGVSPSSFSFSYGVGGSIPPAQTLTVSSLNGATGFSVVPTTTSGGNWLVVSPSSGAIPGSVSVSVSPTTLTVGTYTGSLTLTGFGVGTSVVVPVTLVVGGAPGITTSVSNLSLTSPAGGTASQTIQVTSSDGATVFSYSISSLSNNGGNWLSVSPTTGTTPGSFTVTAAAGNLTPSTYSGSITLSSTSGIGSQKTIPVTFNVTTPASLTLNPTSLSFTAQTGQTNPAAQNVSVSASGNAAVNFTVAATTATGGSWLSATNSGTTPGTVAVSVNISGLAAGTYTGTVTVTAPGTTNSPVSIPVTLTVGNPPSLTALPTSLTFSYQAGSTAPANQSVSISGPNGAGNFNYTVTATTTSGGNWLGASPTSGTTPGSFSVSVSPSSLAAGTYNGTVTVTAASGAGPVNIPVTLTVTAAVTTLTVSPQSLTFNASAGGSAPASQNVSVSTSGASVNYTVAASSTGNWLSATASGATPGTVVVSVNPSALTVGTYTGTLTITSATASNSPQTVQVTLTVSSPPSIVAVPQSLSFFVPADGSAPAPQTVTIISTGSNAAFTTSAVSQGNWLSVSAGGTTPGSVTVSVNPTGLLAGQTYNGAISVNAPSSTPNNIQIPVTLMLASTGAAPLQVAPQAVYLTYTQGSGSDVQRVTVLNNGGGTVNFTVQAQTANCGNWLTAITPSGSATASNPGSLAFNVNPSGLTSQTCRGLLMINDGNGNITNVPVYMAISGGSQSVLLSQTAMNFVAASNGTAPAAQTFQVLNPGSGSMAWTLTSKVLSGGSWLTVASTSGTSQSLSQVGSPVSVTVNPQGLAAGTYYGSIQVSAAGASNSPQFITVSFTVLNAGSGVPASVTPNGVIITGTSGTSDTQMVTISNVGANALTFSSAVITDDGQNWLTVSPASGPVTAGGSTALSLSANLNGVTGGLRHGTLRIAFSDGTVQTVDVQLAVSGVTAGNSAVRSCGSSNLAAEFLTPAQNFQASARVAIPLQVLVKDCSGNLMTSSSTGVDVLVGSSDIRLSYVGNGIWAGTWTPAAAVSVVSLSARAVAVSGGGTATGVATASGLVGPALPNAPPYVGAVVNAASFVLPGLVAPGAMVSVFGSGLADGQAQVFSVPFPNTLQGAQFMVGGVAMPLFYASDGQVNAILPIGLKANERDQLVVVRDTTLSTPIDLLVADVDPGSFATNSQGTGQGAILVNGTSKVAAPVSSSIPGAGPATAGDYISIFMSGLGIVSNPPADGSPSSGTSLTPNPPTVTVGGVGATVSYSGLAPGEVGLYQVNVQVPAGVPTGDAVPVVVTMGNGIANTVTMAVK